MGLHINETKTEFITYKNNGDLYSSSGAKLKKVENFKYLGSHIANTQRDIENRIGQAWGAITKMKELWNSDIMKQLKIDFFRAAIESILISGSQCWTLTKTQEKRLDGTYTRMLRTVIGVSWRDKITNKQLYGNLPKITTTIQTLRLRLAGHCWRNPKEMCHRLLLWEPTHGKRSRGAPATNFIDVLERDTQINRTELPQMMTDR